MKCPFCSYFKGEVKQLLQDHIEKHLDNHTHAVMASAIVELLSKQQDIISKIEARLKEIEYSIIHNTYPRKYGLANTVKELKDLLPKERKGETRRCVTVD